MSERKAHRAYGVPETRGPLTTYRRCTNCGGSGFTVGGYSDPQCLVCDGSGWLLASTTPASVVTKRAKETVRQSQGRGRKGRDM